MKSKKIDFILCLFLGYFGIHKFYEGKVGMGILYLFTFGLFGIGWLVDIVITAKAAFSPAKPSATIAVTSEHIHTSQKVSGSSAKVAKKNSILCARYSSKVHFTPR